MSTVSCYFEPMFDSISMYLRTMVISAENIEARTAATALPAVSSVGTVGKRRADA